MISDRTGTPPSQQRLSFASRMLKDEHTLEFYDITDQSFLYLVFRLLGAGWYSK